MGIIPDRFVATESTGKNEIMPVVSVCPYILTMRTWALKIVARSLQTEAGNGSLAESNKRTLFSDILFPSVRIQLRQNEGTKSKTVTPSCAIKSKSDWGSLRRSVEAITTVAPSDNGTINCLTEDEKEIEAE